ncbi:class I SAM-dependent methyltransferase [Polymorphobacter arshaanensis]|uniref:Class I SAM-dependent methyltransferase n=1 Tax=Glacieibacterium arshaanense TaxID=2511025 RepID=A0A4Y9EKR5_9SPHN|nr:class I SAM-dependent methyltransferase [Polymorphobacter arshaanensis]TFU01294.1 class I SAM-dependent methyltransferase [Polymorphobacter arshaanensis]
MTASADDATLAFYAREAPDYVASGFDGASRHLPGFLQRLKPGARLLELGCGGGRDAEAMLQQGFDVVPTDGVPEMAQKAAERLGIPVAVMRFDELVADTEYDAVWAHASLLHVPRAGLVPVLASIHRALRPGGLHFACYKAGGTEARDRFDRLNNHLSLEQARAAYRAAAPWRIIETQSYMGGGYDGVQGPWISIIVERASGGQA